ncbi:hypothetical protein QBC46DRAFT_343747 [Diplogelasinospora grovesii]|uniref:RING-type domain-containing protein n=1 Tax=Diplogelasinospora grovesii TaxID=303347 RepID=A0AAN6N334_9PEZI|nr:hypothetical protein QBC46DRAFT_343747 [Diplogelasinospora grovesii]
MPPIRNETRSSRHDPLGRRPGQRRVRVEMVGAPGLDLGQRISSDDAGAPPSSGHYVELTLNGITIKLDSANLQATNSRLICGGFTITLNIVPVQVRAQEVIDLTANEEPDTAAEEPTANVSYDVHCSSCRGAVDKGYLLEHCGCIVCHSCDYRHIQRCANHPSNGPQYTVEVFALSRRCSICLDTDINEWAALGVCGHTFHEACLMGRDGQACPICRTLSAEITRFAM